MIKMNTFGWRELKHTVNDILSIVFNELVWKLDRNIFNFIFITFLDAVKTALDAVETGLDVAVETKNLVEDRIKDLIEGFRKQMGKGFDALGIPRLDPLEINHLDFQINHQIGKYVD